MIVGGDLMGYASKFKEDFKFLEKYGFAFTVDPFNKGRPCYQNRFGEIILWVNDISLYIYVQVNGWRKDINVKEEYKNIFKKSTLKPLHVMFEELFVYLVNTTGKFYDLEVIPGDNYIVQEVSMDNFSADINPSNFKLKTGLIISLLVVFSVMMLGCLGILYSFDYIKSSDVHYFLECIIYLFL